MWSWFNDDLVPVEQARVSVLDRGFLYGDAIFDTMAAYDGAIFRLATHLDRLETSADLLGLTVPVGRTELEHRLYACLEKNGRRDAILRLTLTRGRGARGLATDGCTDPTLVILCYPPKLYPPRMIETGARLIVSSIQRIPAEALPAIAKTANYLNNILAYREAAEKGADEALMLTTTGDVAEGSVSNIFLVSDGALRTPSPDCGVMPGITRTAVIDVARGAGIPVREERIAASELYRADEIFYTNTTATVMPVGRIDARGLPAPGPITRRLRAGLLDAIEREAGRFWRAETG